MFRQMTDRNHRRLAKCGVARGQSGVEMVASERDSARIGNRRFAFTPGALAATPNFGAGGPIGLDPSAGGA
jgi:hypothetical protein